MASVDYLIPDYLLCDFDTLARRGDLDGAIAQRRFRGVRLDKDQAWDLIRAGWRFELPDSDDPDPMSFYWRSPPKRKGSRGRFYPSTNQAWNALMRERAKG